MLLPSDTPGLRATAHAIADGRRTAREIVDEALERIAAWNTSLGAFLSVNPHAGEVTRLPRGPLHGLPISLKDLILTRGMPTTGGSRSFGPGIPGVVDAPVARRLRRAGAVLLGKTNLHELAMGVTTENEHFGPARNPHDPTRMAGGSSGGSAVAVATGMGLASLGTDTRGSIRIPAACCGIVGLKPTYGLVDATGVIPLSPSLDHVGPMTRTVEDAALLLGVLVGGRHLERYLNAVDAPGPAPRLGLVPEMLQGADPIIRTAVSRVAEWGRRAGMVVTEVSLPECEAAHRASGVITGAEALAFHEERLADVPEGFGPRLRERLQRGRELTAVDLVRAEQTQALVTAAFARAFVEADVLLGAVLPVLPPPLGTRTVPVGGTETAILDAFTRYNAPANMAGVPALTLPIGMHEGLPIAAQLLAPWRHEARLLRVGCWIEQQRDALNA